MGNSISSLSSRYAITITAQHIDVPIEEIKLECNNGFTKRIDASDDFTADEMYYEFNQAMKKMKLEAVPRSAVFRPLAQIVGENMPRHLEISDVVYVFNNVHLHYDLQPDYSELKKYWAVRYKENALKYSEQCRADVRHHEDSAHSDNAEYFNENARYLSIEGSGYALLSNELKRFGGMTKRFSRRDAMSIMFRCSEKHDLVSCVQFCKSMERCVQCIMNPPLTHILRQDPYVSLGDPTVGD